MVNLAVVLWGALALASAPDSVVGDVLCDDNASAWDQYGMPNWACTIEGCSPHESSCWDYRLDHCYDDDGVDLGECAFQKSTCGNRLDCFNLWVYCEGSYECHSDTILGCTNGTCTSS